MAQHSAPPSYGPAGRSGLVTFAGILLVIGGAFNLLDGIVALAKDDRFRADELLFGDLSAWGIWWLIIGILLLFAGWQVLQRKDIGMMLGIGFAGLNAFTQLMFLGAYPAWSISIMVLDLIVIYALSAHSAEFE
jgi:hypothetical protein